MKPVSREKIVEWTENPVTLLFKAIAEKERKEYEGAKGLDCFTPFDPQKTQELLATMNGCVDTWDLVIAALEGEGIMDDEEDDE